MSFSDMYSDDAVSISIPRIDISIPAYGRNPSPIENPAIPITPGAHAVHPATASPNKVPGVALNPSIVNDCVNIERFIPIIIEVMMAIISAVVLIEV